MIWVEEGVQKYSVVSNGGSVFVFRTPVCIIYAVQYTGLSALIGRCCALRQEVFHEEGEGLPGRRRTTEPG